MFSINVILLHNWNIIEYNETISLTTALRKFDSDI